MRRWFPPALLVALLLVTIAYAARPSHGGGEAARVDRIASEVRCPTCKGLSVAESDAEAAKAAKVFIRQRVEAGDSDGQIKAQLAARYGNGILLRPSSSGVSGLVWAIPVVAVVAGAAGLSYAFWRWRTRTPRTPTDADAVLVERARRA
jgi:cytochrome c-type biogenesis protein CcmH